MNRSHAYAILADLTAALNVIAGLLFDLRVMVLLIPAIFACCASWAAFRTSRRKERQIAVETVLAIQKICEECKAGTPPSNCPLNQNPAVCRLH